MIIKNPFNKTPIYVAKELKDEIKIMAVHKGNGWNIERLANKFLSKAIDDEKAKMETENNGKTL
ncbi:MAG: hypothetical protein WC974_08950 [Thermoplasmata archaeon]